MSAEHARALHELRKFREQVSTFQQLISGFPSDARPTMAPGVIQRSATDSREDLNVALNTLLSQIGFYEVLLQSKGG